MLRKYYQKPKPQAYVCLLTKPENPTNHNIMLHKP